MQKKEVKSTQNSQAVKKKVGKSKVAAKNGCNDVNSNKF